MTLTHQRFLFFQTNFAMSYRRNHDIYDDTRYGRDAYYDGRERHPRRTRQRRGERHDGRQVQPDIWDGSHEYRSRMERPHAHGIMERQMDPFEMTPFGSSMFGGSLFGAMNGMMASFDRMFDEMTAGNGFRNADGDGRGGTYFYESKTRTIGPDGRVREEVVRTAPGSDGHPETRRSVREGDDVRGMDPFAIDMDQGGWNARHGYGQDRITPAEDDVIVEELDEYGNVVNSNVQPQRAIEGHDEHDDDRERGGWWHNRLGRTRDNRA